MKGRKADIIDLLKEYRDCIHILKLEQAFTLLREEIVSLCDDGSLRTEALTLCESYDLMLESLLRTEEDPDRHRIYLQMAKWGLELYIRILLKHNDLSGSDHFSQQRRQRAQHPLPSYAELQEQLESSYTRGKLLNPQDPRSAEERDDIGHQTMKSLDELFEKITLSDLWNESEAREMYDLAQSAVITDAQLAVVVSAITLSLVHHFDERKYLQLIGLCCHRNLQVSQRALVGVCLCVACNHNKMTVLDTEWDAVALLSELPQIRERLQCIQLQFIHATIAQHIAKEMQSNVIYVPHPSSFPSEDEMEGRDMLQEEPMPGPAPSSTKEDKMRQTLQRVQEWQREGEDVYLSSFSNLKHFSFFLDPAHWFYPFDEENPYVRPILEQFNDARGRTLRDFLQSVVFCDSDKYSFTLSLKTMNESQIGLFVQQLDEQRDAVMDHVTFHNSTRRRAESMKEITRHYVQDLNRYFKYWRYHHELEDPFEDQIDIHVLRPFHDLMTDADFALKALKLLHRWSKHSRYWTILYYRDIEHLEPYKERCKKWRIEGAIAMESWHEAADMLGHILQENPYDLWAIRTMLSLAPKDRNIRKEGLYKLWLEVEPDNKKAIIGLAQELLKNEKFEEALPLLHKWEYLAKDPVEAYRALVWTLLNLHRYDDARHYSGKVMNQGKASFDDYLNAGHIAFMQGQMKEARRLYLEAVPRYKGKGPLNMRYRIGELELLINDNPERKIDLALVTDIVIREMNKRESE